MTTGCPNHPEVVTGLARCSRCGIEHCPDCLILLQGKGVCAQCKSQDVLDIRSNASQVDDGQVPLASRWQRLCAALVDTCIFLLVMLPFWLPHVRHAVDAAGKPIPVGWIYLVCTSSAGFVYEFLMLVAYGQTLGKMALGIRVVQRSGERLRPRHALIRTLFKSAMGVGGSLGKFAGILPLIDDLAIFNSQRRCLHDYCAQTAVVKKIKLAADASSQ
jgi:uncharacterized RDD family membrane protein YckC